VVDNGSTDGTQELLKRYEDDAHIRSVHEPAIGLSRARNTGWRNARGEYVGYIDDDAVAEEGWLESAVWCFENVSPPPFWVGGPIRLEWETGPPEWINEELRVPLGEVYWGAEPCRLGSEQRLGGGNSFYSRKKLAELGGFEERLGRQRGSLLSGEEMQLQRRVERIGESLYYHPGVCVRHFVPAERSRPAWFYRRYYWGGVSDCIMAKTLAREGCPVSAARHAAGKQVSATRRLKKLAKNTWHSLGILAPERDVIYGRIYLAYVLGRLVGGLVRN